MMLPNANHVHPYNMPPMDPHNMSHPGFPPRNDTGFAPRNQRFHQHNPPHQYPPFPNKRHRGGGPPAPFVPYGPPMPPVPQPKNDYNQHFVDTGERPQNFIRDCDYNERFVDFPKLKRLIELKDDLARSRATDPMYLQCDLKCADLAKVLENCKFDVVLIDPPWEEYNRRCPTAPDGSETVFWTVDEIGRLNIPAITASPSFLFLWVGNGRSLDEGRQLMSKWGFRRAEDIVWIKTNKQRNRGPSAHQGAAVAAGLDDDDAVFVGTKEHCLMGIKGTVRRNTDGHLIHANVDTDILIAEEPPNDAFWKKPTELYHLIEHFCLGRRRLELFGEDHNIRPGWLTLGGSLTSSNFNLERYLSFFIEGEELLGTTAEIEELRPKSPPRKPGVQSQAPPPMSVIPQMVPQMQSTHRSLRGPL